MAEWVSTVPASFHEHVEVAARLLNNRHGEPSGVWLSRGFITKGAGGRRPR